MYLDVLGVLAILVELLLELHQLQTLVGILELPVLELLFERLKRLTLGIGHGSLLLLLLPNSLEIPHALSYTQASKQANEQEEEGGGEKRQNGKVHELFTLVKDGNADISFVPFFALALSAARLTRRCCCCSSFCSHLSSSTHPLQSELVVCSCEDCRSVSEWRLVDSRAFHWAGVRARGELLGRDTHNATHSTTMADATESCGSSVEHATCATVSQENALPDAADGERDLQGVASTLERRLAVRPEPDELIARNVLKGSSFCNCQRKSTGSESERTHLLERERERERES